MSLYQFLQSRIQMGRIDPIGVARASRAVRTLPAETRLALCRPQADELVAGPNGRLDAREISFREACALVNAYHRHHGSPVGHLFSGGVFDGQTLCAAVIAGRPVARKLDDGKTVELTRVAADGTRNACSKAMGWAIREAWRRGFTRVITYTLESEPGGSLRAVGFQEAGASAGGSWNRPSRKRARECHPLEPKRRWEILRLAGTGIRKGAQA